MVLSKSWAPSNGSFFSAFRASGSLGCLLAVGLLSLIGAVPAAKSRRIHNLFSALHLANTIAEIRDTLRCYLVSWRRTAIAFSLTVAAHLFYFGTFYCTGRALEGNIMARVPSLSEILSIMPIVNTLTALPISFAGIGVRESLFQVLLHDLCRAPEAIGVLIGALGFAIRLLWGLPGGARFFGIACHAFLESNSVASTPSGAQQLIRCGGRRVVRQHAG